MDDVVVSFCKQTFSFFYKNNELNDDFQKMVIIIGISDDDVKVPRVNIIATGLLGRLLYNFQYTTTTTTYR